MEKEKTKTDTGIGGQATFAVPLKGPCGERVGGRGCRCGGGGQVGIMNIHWGSENKDIGTQGLGRGARKKKRNRMNKESAGECPL